VIIKTRKVDPLAEGGAKILIKESNRDVSSSEKSSTDRKYLDDKVQVSLVLITCCRRVRSNDQLSVDTSGQVDVLSDGQAEDMFIGRKPKPETTSIVTYHFFLNQFQRIFGIGICKWTRKIISCSF
jgi:hypothetical protein